MDRGGWLTTVYGVAELDMSEATQQTLVIKVQDLYKRQKNRSVEQNRVIKNRRFIKNRIDFKQTFRDYSWEKSQSFQ